MIVVIIKLASCAFAYIEFKPYILLNKQLLKKSKTNK